MFKIRFSTKLHMLIFELEIKSTQLFVSFEFWINTNKKNCHRWMEREERRGEKELWGEIKIEGEWESEREKESCSQRHSYYGRTMERPWENLKHKLFYLCSMCHMRWCQAVNNSYNSCSRCFVFERHFLPPSPSHTFSNRTPFDSQCKRRLKRV